MSCAIFREVGVPVAREFDAYGLEPVRVGHRHALLVEEVGLDAVRVALQLHRPPLHVVENGTGEVDVVPDEVALGASRRREEDFVLVRERELAVSDQHVMKSAPSTFALRAAALRAEVYR